MTSNIRITAWCMMLAVAWSGPVAAQQASSIPSLFFSPNEIAAIRAALNAYRPADHTSQDEDFLKTLTMFKPSPANVQYYTYPQFFLESLVYHAPTDWIIWVNGQKLTPETARANTDLQVISVDASAVMLQWQPSALDKNQGVWNRSPAGGVAADNLMGTVTFTLHANQTFSSYMMQVLEGKVLPVTVDLRPPAAEESGSPVAGPAAPVPAAVPQPAGETAASAPVPAAAPPPAGEAAP